MHLIAGLGNPGRTYENTRHNVGFMVIDRFSEIHGIPVHQQKFNALVGRGQAAGQPVLLAKPLSYMNRSGIPVSRLMQYHRIQSKDMLVIHDDIDLAYGVIKIKEKGGHGGHKGVRSIMETMGGGWFLRLRIGIGRSAGNIDVADYVLSRFHTGEASVLDDIIQASAEAVETVLRDGAAVGMNKFNNKILLEPR